MADHSVSTATSNPAMDYEEHERTYRGFVTLTKWGSIVVAIIVVGMYIFLV